MKNTLLVVGIFTVLLITGCVRTTTTNDQLKVVTSFYPLYYFASQIGGDYAAVTNLTPAGAEPHDYELTPQDIATIQDSQLLIMNGSKFEPWADSVTVDLSEATTVLKTGVSQTDPHEWLSPQLAQTEVTAITNGFIQVDPTHTAEYTANSQRLIEKLQQLDQAYLDGLAHCDSNVFVTSHAAFSYLASDYGLEQLPIAGLSPDAEPTLDALANITDFAREHQVQYIFFERLVSPKLSETIATEVGAQTLVLNPIEGLTDEEVAAGQDYVTVMEANLVNLRIALRCQ